MPARTAERIHANRVKAWQSMPPELKPLAQLVRSQVIDSAQMLFVVHWEIGNQVNAVRVAPERYGANALEQLHDFFRAQSQRLIDDAIVAARFDRARVIELAKREMRNGRHLSWKHLVLLARVPAGKMRDQLIESTFMEALTVAELKSRIDSLYSSDSGNSQATRKPKRKLD